MKNIYSIVGLLVIGLIAGCGNGSTTGSNQKTLNSKKTLWSDSHLSHYKFTYQIGCFCLPREDVVISVNDGQVVEAFNTPSGTYLNQETLTGLPTVEVLFAKAQEAIDKHAYSLSITYNPQYGFPEHISIRWSKDVPDDGVDYFIKDFQ